MKLVPETFEEMVGLRLTEIRKKKNLTQGAAGRVCGITQSAMSRIERGATAITVIQMRKLARLFNKNPCDFAYDLLKTAEKGGF